MKEIQFDTNKLKDSLHINNKKIQKSGALVAGRDSNDYEIQNEGAHNRRMIFMQEKINQKELTFKEFRTVSIQDDILDAPNDESIHANQDTINEMITHPNTQNPSQQNQTLSISHNGDQLLVTDQKPHSHNPTGDSTLSQIGGEDLKINEVKSQNITCPIIPRHRKTTLFLDCQIMKLRKCEDSSVKNSVKQKGNQMNSNDVQERNSMATITKNYFIIITYMKKFANQLKKKIYFHTYTHLKPQHYQMIDDKAYFEDVQHPKMNQSFMNRSQTLEKKKTLLLRSITAGIKSTNFVKKIGMSLLLINFDFVILPNSIWLILWEFFILIFFMVLLWVVTVAGCFGESSYLTLYFYLQLIAIIAFSLDIILSFQIGFYEFGQVVTDKKRILNYYIQRKFVIDFVSTLIFAININYGLFWLDYFALFLRFQQVFLIFTLFVKQLYSSQKQISQKIERINEYFRIQNKHPVAYELVQLISMLLIIAHLFGCGFFYIGDNYKGDYSNQLKENNWVDATQLRGQSLETKYLTALYFCVITMVTVGYGDITPISIYEKTYVIGMVMIACGVFAYTVNTIGNIFSKLREKSVSYLQKQFQLMNYMDSRNIKKETQMKILKYLEYIEKGREETRQQGLDILEQFPASLREEVQREYYYKILSDQDFLNMHFSKKFLGELSLKMKEITFGPWEKVITRGVPQDNLYFLIKGQVQYCTDNRENNKFIYELPAICISENTSHFGLLQDCYRCSICFIPRFYRCSQIESEKLCFLRDQYLNDKRYDYSCLSCTFYGHSIVDCPQLHYNIDKSEYLYKTQHSLIQNRNSILRKEKKLINALMSRDLISKTLKTIRLIILSEKNEHFKNISVIDEIEKFEDDRMFFLNIPRIFKSKQQPARKSLLQNQQMSSEYSGYQFQTHSSEEYFNNSESQGIGPSILSNEKIVSKQKIAAPTTDFPSQEILKPQLFSNYNNRMSESNELHSNSYLNQLPFEQTQAGIYEIPEKENESTTMIEQGGLTQSATCIHNDPYQAILLNQQNQNNSIQLQLKSQLTNNDLNDEKQYVTHSEKRKRSGNRDQTLNWGTIQRELLKEQDDRQNQIQSLLMALFSENNQRTPKRSSRKKGSYTDTIRIPSNQRKNAINLQPVANTSPQLQEEKGDEYISQYLKGNTFTARDAHSYLKDLHFFGKLSFKFDSMKEYQIYYPKNNFSNVIKAYKKTQNILYIKFKYKRNKNHTDQIFNSPHNIEQSAFVQSTKLNFHKKC